ncbi:MerR family transcriptional regulator [Acidobacteriota bacterium]
MKDDSNRGLPPSQGPSILYTAKDIRNYLGISPGQLFHWGRTWGLFKPWIKADGRQGKDKYSLKNILFIALIKELLNFGINLSWIKDIIASHFDIAFREGDFLLADIFEYYLLEFSAKKDNLYLLIAPVEIEGKRDYFWTLIDTINSSVIEEPYKTLKKMGKKIESVTKSIILIDLKRIITEMELITGEKFEIPGEDD